MDGSGDNQLGGIQLMEHWETPSGERAVTDDCLDQPPVPLDDELEAHCTLARETIGSAQLLVLRTIALQDERGVYERDGHRDMASYVAAREGISRYKARRWVACGHAIEKLPRLTEALGAGTLGLDKVLELARFATEETEAKLISWARRVTLGAVKSKADEAVAVDDETKETQKDSAISWWWMDDGRMWFEGPLRPDQGALIAAGLTETADSLPRDPDSNDDFAARCAAALTLLVTQHASVTAEVVVHTPVSALQDGTGNGRIAGGPVLSPEFVARLATDARLRFVLTEEDGNPLGIGRASRDVPKWLEEVVRHRDDYRCTFPGCDCRNEAWLKSHHLHWWGWTGPTDLDNLVTVCSFHHTLIHVMGWRVALGKDGTTRWFRPDGSHYDPGPAPPPQLISEGPYEGRRLPPIPKLSYAAAHGS